MTDKVSVVIPTYKRYDKLDRALKSVVNQTYKNIEIIVVDDNALNKEDRNETEKIVAKYDVILIKNKKNLGGSLSRNAGIKASTGEFVAFLDDDDEFAPTKIEKLIDRYHEVNDSKCGLVYSDMIRIYDNGKKEIVESRIEGNNLYDYMKYFLVPTSCWLVPKYLFKDVLFEDVSNQQDALFLLRLFEKGYNVYGCKEALTNVYVHNSAVRISNISDKYIKAFIHYIEECRKDYYLFNEKQKEEIEFRTSYLLCDKYLRNNNYKNAVVEAKKMFKMRWYSKSNIHVIYKLLRYRIHYGKK